jgi:hypothetical protein
MSPVAGSPNAVEDYPLVSIPSALDDTDDITWLNVAENSETQKVIDVCVECW